MDFWILLSAVGSFASIIGFLLPSPSKRQKVFHIVYGLIIVLMTSVSVKLWSENQRKINVEYTARKLSEQAYNEFSSIGFIHATLAFLEKNKDLYPETYDRAKEVCKINNCFGLSYRDGTNNIPSDPFNKQEVFSAFQGLLKGIGILESKK